MSNLISVQFHEDSIFIINHEEQPFVPMRPIVRGIGLDWTGQQVKLKANEQKFSCRDISTTGRDGKKYKMICIPLKKLNGWLFSINPEKVKPEIRDKVVAYQEECFAVLHDYWNHGIAVNPRINSKHLFLLKQIVFSRACQIAPFDQKLVRSLLWGALKQEFNLASYKDLPESRFDEAKQFLEKVVLEGEWIPKPKSARYHYPAEIAKPRKNSNDTQAWLNVAIITSPEFIQPLVDCMQKLEEDGNNVDGLKIIIDGVMHKLHEISQALPATEKFCDLLWSVLNRGMNVTWDKNGGFCAITHSSKFTKN